MSNNSATTHNSNNNLQVSCTLLDKYRPSSIEEIIHNHELKEQVVVLAILSSYIQIVCILSSPVQSAILWTAQFGITGPSTSLEVLNRGKDVPMIFALIVAT